MTASAVGRQAASEVLRALNRNEGDVVVALVGNPNVGKSTLFNRLTGLSQHTGNWPGKTVALAAGRFSHGGKNYLLVDLPGTYSLSGVSPEEEVTAEFLRSGRADMILAVCDATCLARSLGLVLQCRGFSLPMVVCLNLMDEASRYGKTPDAHLLSDGLALPVVATSASKGSGLESLKEHLSRAQGELRSVPISGIPDPTIALREGQKLAASCQNNGSVARRTRLDRFLTGRFTGGAVMMVLLFLVFWLTIRGANGPSRLLQMGFDGLGALLRQGAERAGLPAWLSAPLLDGVYATTATVISVMLPPMAIFFPLFTLLEDLGYLPRAAFLMDEGFRRCGSCGKQALTMCMGFGCNAAGVVGCRIISSPRERKIAVLTNALVPCNGRFPMLMALIAAFFPDNASVSACALMLLVLLSVGVTMLASLLLGETCLRGQESSFIMEMPPFRRPRILQLLYRSLVDRTVYILGRAAAVAAPAGLVLWCMTTVKVGDVTLLRHLADFLHPAGMALGVPGAVLAALILGFPANELVLPVLLTTVGAGSAAALPEMGWNASMALCTLLLLLFHWPCSTTCITVWKETKSIPMTFGAILVPTAAGVLLAALCSGIFRMFA